MEKLRPDIYQKSLEDIHFNYLKDTGIKVILLDMDNTILKYGEKEIEENILKCIQTIKSEFTLVLFSNSSLARVKKIGEDLDIPYISFAFKPSKRGFKKVFKKYKVEPEEVAIIGDQLFTDIKGGNKVGITTILVDPLNEEDGMFTKVNRKREKRTLQKMGAAGLFFKERYYE
jgi:HAD superfamily phosphatase (TIGR01668 family)